MGTGTLTLGVKRPEREAYHSSPSSAEVEECGAISPLPQYAFTAWCSVEHRDFTETRELCLYPWALQL